MKGLILNPIQMKGQEQMILDLNLLEKNIKDPAIAYIVRFYTWEGNWLSIGKNQKIIPEEWLMMAKEKKINLVRRPSGGNAVLHSQGLTYSLIWNLPPKSKKESYYLISKWLIEGFHKLGINLRFGKEDPDRTKNNCFDLSTSADLIDEDGNKLIGSAQYWKKGTLLQHGEILLRPEVNLWKDLFNSPPPKTNKIYIKRDLIRPSLIKSLSKNWPHIEWEAHEIKHQEIERIKSKVALYNYEFKIP